MLETNFISAVPLNLTFRSAFFVYQHIRRSLNDCGSRQSILKIQDCPRKSIPFPVPYCNPTACSSLWKHDRKCTPLSQRFFLFGYGYHSTEKSVCQANFLNADKHSLASSARSTKRWVSGMLMSVGVESSHWQIAKRLRSWASSEADCECPLYLSQGIRSQIFFATFVKNIETHIKTTAVKRL